MREEREILAFAKESHTIRLTNEKLAINLSHGLRSRFEALFEDHLSLKQAVGWMFRYAYPEDIMIRDIAEARVTASRTVEILVRSRTGMRVIPVPELTGDEAERLVGRIAGLLRAQPQQTIHKSLVKSFGQHVIKVEWILVVLGLLALWEILLLARPSQVFPGPSRIGSVWWESFASGQDLIGKMLLSYRNLVLGLFLAASFAVPLAILVALGEKLDLTMTPVMMLISSLPDLAILPILVYLVGYGAFAAIVMISIASFFPIYFSVREGVRSISTEHVEAARVLGAGRLSLLREVVLPAAWPNIVTGFRLAFSYCWQIILAIEMIALVPGVGLFIKEMVMAATPQLDLAFAAIFTVGLAVLTTDRFVFARLEERIGRWRR